MARNDDIDLMEERVVEKFLRCMPKKYAQIVMSIETLLNFEQLTVEDVTRRLKAVQDYEEGPHAEPGAARGKLLYTMEQWRAFEKEEGSGPSGSSKECRRRPRCSKEKGPGLRQVLMAAPSASARRPGMTPATTAAGRATGPRTVAFTPWWVGSRRASRRGSTGASNRSKKQGRG
jgi:hypothetical protein